MKTGIRKEDKSIFERRVPFVPEHIKELMEKGFDIAVQSSPQRAFTDKEFSDLGIPVVDNLDDRDIIFGIKEIPESFFKPDKIYVFFAHVIKGQSYNMPMLKRMMSLKDTLFDYERIVDDNNRRLIFFGRHAGLSGMVNSLWALGKRFETEGIDTPFKELKQMKDYHDLSHAQAAIKKVRDEISKKGLPKEICPFIIGIAGYGNVSKGAREICDILPVEEIKADDVPKIASTGGFSTKKVYKVVYKEEDCVKPMDPHAKFDLNEYYKLGKTAYESIFEDQLDHLSLLVNCIYWDERYPRLVTMDKCKKMWQSSIRPKLRVIGDISCDIKGAVECTVKATDPGNPVFVFDPEKETATDGFKGKGIVIMAVDILPAEIPRESSIYFSNVLKNFLPEIANADFTKSFKDIDLPGELKRSVILYHGKLTPEYEYLKEYIKP